jgi:hypothetical protein
MSLLSKLLIAIEWLEKIVRAPVVVGSSPTRLTPYATPQYYALMV